MLLQGRRRANSDALSESRGAANCSCDSSIETMPRGFRGARCFRTRRSYPAGRGEMGEVLEPIEEMGDRRR